jgi:hypothetical protein
MTKEPAYPASGSSGVSIFASGVLRKAKAWKDGFE